MSHQYDYLYGLITSNIKSNIQVTIDQYTEPLADYLVGYWVLRVQGMMMSRDRFSEAQVSGMELNGYWSKYP